MVKTVSLKDEKPWLMGLLHVEKVFLERKKKSKNALEESQCLVFAGISGVFLHCESMVSVQKWH